MSVGMEKQTGKLTTKDFIIAGAFAALYVALLFVVVSATGFIPVVYICAPFILSIVLGPVYMLYAAKTPKRWSVMILGALADTHPLALSGGQKQRVAVAGAICAGKEFLVYDEPTSGQDYQSMIAACDLIRAAAEEAFLSLVITHDMEFILNCCTSVLHLERGMVKAYYPLGEAGIEKIKAYFNAKTGGNEIVQESA